MTINFYLNNDPKSTRKECVIYCYVRNQGNTLVLRTDERIEKKYWDVKGQKAKRSYTGSPELNDFLSRYKEKLKEIIRVVKIEDPFMPFEQIKRHILKQVSNKQSIDFFQVLATFIDTRKAIVSKSTTQKFITLTKHLKDFSKQSNIQINLDTIDLAFFDSLHNYFLSVEITNNTIHKNIQFIRSFLRWCYEREYTKNQKFEDFKNVKLVETDKIALTKEDLNKIISSTSLDEKLNKVRDIFLFQLYTGQRYSDIEKFQLEDVKNNVWYLRQLKTKKPIEIPLIDIAVQILEKYKGELPVISNQKMNQYLKELGAKVGLNDKIKTTKYIGAEIIEEQQFKYELLTTHTARRTFVSLASYDGVNQQVVKSFTGHGTDKMLSQYFKKNNNESKKIIENIFTN